MIFENQIDPASLRDVSLKSLAHLGDAVFELYEREKEVLTTSNTKNLHNQVVLRVNALSQANILEKIQGSLTDKEKDIVRRARNMKVNSYKKIDQSVYRLATAFEALLGYLYLTDLKRLEEILKLTEE